MWRFLLHQLRHNLRHTAHKIYLEGLERTGITIEAIPRIEHMNECLNEIGWRAVVVDGFIPPAIFMEFQAHCVLVVAVAMRNIEHMLYTPAPDIVHESAGHAPFIIDTDYAEFLQRFGELGMKAIANKGDMNVYESIRGLSIIRETSGASQTDIEAAEKALSRAIEENDKPSEASLLSRLHWWTVEYGLVGEPDDYRIFGAGLLSSLGESINCLDDGKVAKLPLTVDAIDMPYDITNEQPQLFVTKNCRHLNQVLEEYGRQMCVNRGGAESVEKAIAAETVNTVMTNAGVEISGQFSRMLTDAAGNIIYLNTVGPTQLAYQGKQLAGHGIDAHKSGFGSPVGRLKTMEYCLSSSTVDGLKEYGIQTDKTVKLEFLSGIVVAGLLVKILRQEQKNLLFTFEQCTVVGSKGEILFDPDWGVFDMVIGDTIVSVYGGPADKEMYPLYKGPSQKAAIHTDYDESTIAQFKLYQAARDMRTEAKLNETLAMALIEQLHQQKCDEWLLYFEILELALECQLDVSLCRPMVDKLRQLVASASADRTRLIQYGLDRLPLERLGV